MKIYTAGTHQTKMSLPRQSVLSEQIHVQPQPSMIHLNNDDQDMVIHDQYLKENSNFLKMNENPEKNLTGYGFNFNRFGQTM